MAFSRVTQVEFFNGKMAMFRNRAAIFLRSFGDKIAKIINIWEVILDLIAISSPQNRVRKNRNFTPIYRSFLFKNVAIDRRRWDRNCIAKCDEIAILLQNAIDSHFIAIFYPVIQQKIDNRDTYSYIIATHLDYCYSLGSEEFFPLRWGTITSPIIEQTVVRNIKTHELLEGGPSRSC